jgi:octaheme c-type cytochrome (tetrathionate reductase family)
MTSSPLARPPVRRVVAVVATLVIVGGGAAAVRAAVATAAPALSFARKTRPHFDHAPVITQRFDSPGAVTRACLGCHPKSAEVMHTEHFTWLGDEVKVGEHAPTRIGKKNLINNFCIATPGNEVACMKCHAGYGWVDAKYDFQNPENVDCLVCHEHAGTYVKDLGGMPAKDTDLAAAAKSVGTPQRENCLTCHAYGGGGQGVKHGDLDSSLNHPLDEDDVHMSRLGFLCVDCHDAPDHRIRGRAFSVSVGGSHGVACGDCHAAPKHDDARIDAHLGSVACQACHIPSFARRLPTKAYWDWSKAGDQGRADDPHKYLKIKGEFIYEQDAIPEYRWFDETVDRYLVGDRIDPAHVVPINAPHGSIRDKNAKIWPFKIHRARQPYDVDNRTLLPPLTGGKDGYWTKFDWDDAFRRGAEANGIPYSGHYAFTETEMAWPITHMVTPKDRALGCTDCHGESTRLDWTALGYAGDPLRTGGRP